MRVLSAHVLEYSSLALNNRVTCNSLARSVLLTCKSGVNHLRVTRETLARCLFHLFNLLVDSSVGYCWVGKCNVYLGTSKSVPGQFVASGQPSMWKKINKALGES